VEWLNYHHLHYFWLVAREGSVGAAARRVRLAQPTLSGQIRLLEDRLGAKLFRRAGRGLVLTEIGQVAYRYADEIFGLGRELLDSVKAHGAGPPARLVVGVADVVPKLVAHRLLLPALRLAEPVHLVCREDHTERLLAELALHGLDLVISDAAVPPQAPLRAFSHLLGECGISIFGAPRLAAAHRRGFPRCLDGAPLLLPTDNTVLRRSLESFFDAQGIRPRVAAEFEDSALLGVFAEAGQGLFAAPTAVEAEIRRQYRVALAGRIEAVRERFYAISLERRLRHPAVLAILEGARQRLFA